MSAGVSTTHKSEASRLGLSQIRQIGTSLKLRQRSQCRTPATAADKARARRSPPLPVTLQEVEGHALGGLGSHPRQAAQGPDQFIDEGAIAVRLADAGAEIRAEIRAKIKRGA